MVASSRRGVAVEIKICGITNSADAGDAIDCGVDALGINLFPGSKRFVDVKSADPWIRELPERIKKVAVMVNPPLDEATAVAESGLFDVLQLHGDESAEFCEELTGRAIPFIKALPMIDQTSLDQATEFFTPNILLDSRSAEGFGGTGRFFPWSLAARFIADHPQFRVNLAGGLTPENVVEAIIAAGPAGVDVTTGVEASPGRKDRSRLQAFVAAVRGL
jgi:phosphoribosylanthranilate isomerase